MPWVRVLTTDLALRIERFVAPEVSLPHPVTVDPSAPCVAQFGTTIASKSPRAWPGNKVFCFGHEDVGRLDEILAYFAAGRLEPTFYVAPMVFTRDVAAALTALGFVQREFEQAILYGVPDPTPPRLLQGVTIEPVTADNLEEFVRATADGFEWHASWRDAAMEGVRTSVRPGVQHFLVGCELVLGGARFALGELPQPATSRASSSVSGECVVSARPRRHRGPHAASLRLTRGAGRMNFVAVRGPDSPLTPSPSLGSQ